MNHEQRFLVIGFCDAAWKVHGTQITYFEEPDRIELDHIPSSDHLRSYAMGKGLWPSKKYGSSADICNPVYYVVRDGLEYCNCRFCFPSTEVIDNRAAPQ